MSVLLLYSSMSESDPKGDVSKKVDKTTKGSSARGAVLGGVMAAAIGGIPSVLSQEGPVSSNHLARAFDHMRAGVPAGQKDLEIEAARSKVAALHRGYYFDAIANPSKEMEPGEFYNEYQERMFTYK